MMDLSDQEIEDIASTIGQVLREKQRDRVPYSITKSQAEEWLRTLAMARRNEALRDTLPMLDTLKSLCVEAQAFPEAARVYNLAKHIRGLLKSDA